MLNTASMFKTSTVIYRCVINQDNVKEAISLQSKVLVAATRADVSADLLFSPPVEGSLLRCLFEVLMLLSMILTPSEALPTIQPLYLKGLDCCCTSCHSTHAPAARPGARFERRKSCSLCLIAAVSMQHAAPEAAS